MKTMDLSFFCGEVERAFRVLTWYQAEGQNEMDIRAWFQAGMITKEERDTLKELNKKLVTEYI
jgi:hypothetical protein